MGQYDGQAGLWRKQGYKLEIMALEWHAGITISQVKLMN